MSFVFCILVVTYITPSLPYGCISSQVSFLMSLFRNAVRQENRKARFKAGAEHGVDAKRITSSCERCSLSVGIVSIRSKKPFGFSFILLLCSTYFEYSTDGVNGSEPLTTFVNPVHDITLFAYQLSNLSSIVTTRKPLSTTFTI